MDLRVLGALEIFDGSRVVRPRRQMARVLLGVLALRANLPLTRVWLVDALWHGTPPVSAEANVRSYVAHLRELLDGGPAIETAGGGYLLRASPLQLDSLGFLALADEGRRHLAAGDAALARDRTQRALSLWRGPVLGGLDVPDAVADEVHRLEDRRLATVEDHSESRLRLGEHEDLAEDLAALVRMEPLRERRWEQLMLALYRSGRPAEALAAYRRLTEVLADELGAAPGERCQALQQRILRGDTEPAIAVKPRSVPWQLPPMARGFVGRTTEMSALDRRLTTQERGPVRIAVLTGTAGAGKTALALRWAHKERDRFPDGCLYADLGGFGPHGSRRSEEIQAEFLAALGREPAEPLIGTYRTELAGRRMLLILDNAADAEQVRPLLPGDSSAVLVTSRDMLTGLSARDGAHRVDLPALGPDDAVALLRELIGGPADPAALAQLADQCARLPLALRIAADLLAHHRGTPLSALIRDLTDERARLDLLDAGDPHTAVRSVLSWSIRRLSEPVADAFRLVGLYPGRHLDAYALGALAGRPGRALLAALVRAHLVDEPVPGRFAPHDLLRGYAQELAADLPERVRHDALTRLLDQQLSTAAHAMALVYAHEAHRHPKAAEGEPQPRLDTVDEARTWLDGHLVNLEALVRTASDGWPRVAVQLSSTLHRHLLTTGRYADAAQLSTIAVAAAREVGDRRGEAAAASDLGLAYLRMGRHDLAGDQFVRAARLHDGLDDPIGAAATHKNLGMVHYHYGRMAEALAEMEHALAVSRKIGDRSEEGATLNNIGLVYEWSGDWDRAREHYRQALAIHRETGFRVGEGDILNNLSIVERQTGDYAGTVAYLAQALEVYREVGDRGGEGAVLNNLGLACTFLGRFAEAAAYLEDALALHRAMDSRQAELETLVIGGVLAYRRGAWDDAIVRFREVLPLAVGLDLSGSEMSAHYGLGQALLGAGRRAEAAAQFEHAGRMARASGARATLADSLAGLHRATGDPEPWAEALEIYEALALSPTDRL
jgi:DNA-binding SARP family transcriptional activator/Tfp pilus assembly protein PilF